MNLAGMEGLLIPLFAIVGASITLVTLIATNYWRKSQRDDIDATLKMEMIQRGMSADEIERVLRAQTQDCGHVRKRDLARQHAERY
jgi:hypothetical protein